MGCAVWTENLVAFVGFSKTLLAFKLHMGTTITIS
jgi:hypothetical protein